MRRGQEREGKRLISHSLFLILRGGGGDVNERCLTGKEFHFYS